MFEVVLFQIFFAGVVILKLKAAQSDFNWHPPSFGNVLLVFIFVIFLTRIYCIVIANLTLVTCYAINQIISNLNDFGEEIKY